MLSSLAVEPAPSNMGTSMGKSCPSLLTRCGGVSRLMVTPRVSGLERSQEKNLEQHFPEPVSSSTSSASFSCLPSHSPVTASGTVPRHSPFNGNGSRHNGSPPLSKPKPFLTLPGRSHPIYSRYVNYKHLYYIYLYFVFFFLQWIPAGLILLQWEVLCSINGERDSLFIFMLSFFSGAAPQSNLPHLLHLVRLPHPPCAPLLPPPVCRCPTSGAQDPQGPSDPHPEPALGLCSRPHLACLPVHLCYKVLPTRQQQVQSTGMLLCTAVTICWSVSAVHGNTMTNMLLK